MRRLLAAIASGLVLIGVLAGCSSSDSAKDSNGPVKVEQDGDHVTARAGGNDISIGDPQLPDDFPTDDVPLPATGALKAVVSGADGGNQYFTLTYGVPGSDVRSVAQAYRRALEDENFTIKAASSAGSSSGAFTAFTAVSPDWDVVVYDGGTAAAGLLSIQVTTHSRANDLPGSNVDGNE